MLEPQSTVIFVVLILCFGGLIWWLVRTGQIAVRIVAACLAFAVATSFGVLAVNRYFGYYQTWGAAVADFSNTSPNTGPQVSTSSLIGGSHTQAFDAHNVYLKLALQQGYTLHLNIAGKLSHITRSVYIYLPPEYFEPQYKNYRFPVIELIHGQPGEPQDWINVVGVQVSLDSLVRDGKASPAVLVMPDANGGNNISLQCLNQYHGPQDLTYLGEDVPLAVAHILRVQPPGIGWGIAGYSEGGYCAANMALRYRYRYGFAASMSGYFSPFANKIGNPPRLVNPFGHNKLLQRENTPLDEVRALGPGAVMPQFWLGAGQADKQDVANAQYFWQVLQLRQANVPLILTPGGGHTMSTWHAEVPPMLAWMTRGLARAVAHEQQILRARARASRRAASRHAHAHPHHPVKRPARTGHAAT